MGMCPMLTGKLVTGEKPGFQHGPAAVIGDCLHTKPLAIVTNGWEGMKMRRSKSQKTYLHTN